jgi:hypothetical protein
LSVFWGGEVLFRWMEIPFLDVGPLYPVKRFVKAGLSPMAVIDICLVHSLDRLKKRIILSHRNL